MDPGASSEWQSGECGRWFLGIGLHRGARIRIVAASSLRIWKTQPCNAGSLAKARYT